MTIALWPLAGHPLGLGKLKVFSALNEPLNAEVEFTSIADAERKGLNAALASRAEFEAAGAQQLPFLSQIKFTVTQRPDGRYFLHLKTDQPVEEPFLHLLLQVEWPGGRLVREYTALIDPPHYVAGKPAGIEAPRTAPLPDTAPAPAEAMPAPVAEVESEPPAVAEVEPTPPEPVAAEPAVPEEPVAPPDRPVDVAAAPSEAGASESAPRAADSDAPQVTPLDAHPPATAELEAPDVVTTAVAPAAEHAVKRGDTLWAIAERARTDKQLSVQQMALAIFQRNPEAFYRDNMNNLRAGKILKMPEPETVAAISVAGARREFKVQYDVWQEYKLKLASASRGLTVTDDAPAPAPAVAAAPAAAPAEAPKPEARAVAPPEDRSKQPDELLRIVRSTLALQNTASEKKSAQAESPKEAGKQERGALAERVTTLEESLESKKLEQKELGEKLGQVRSQIKNESRLLELENQTLAKVQAQAAPAPQPETKPAPTEKPAPAPPAAAPSAPAETVKSEKPVKKPAVPPPPPPAEKDLLTSVLDAVRDDSMLPIVVGVLVLAGGGILLVYMRRRRRSIAEFEESILASDAIATDSNATTDTSGQAVTTGDTSFLSDFSQGGMGHVHTDEVDPIAEAEVYLAYGRDETAEEILKEAIVKNPERQELKLKLLEIYHQRNDVGAFETLAEELYAALAGRGGKVWDKVEEMGRRLNPDNPMFRGGAPGARRAGDQAATGPVAAASAATAPRAAMAAPAESAPTQLAPAGLDFDFEAAAPRAAAAGDGELNLDFNTGAGGFAAGAKDAALESVELSRASMDDGMIQFAQVEHADAAADVAVDLAPAPAEAADDIKWEAEGVDAAADEAAPGSAAEGGTQQWDETATKLDLAKAYIDMGDAEGARSILDEVLAEGNEDQKKQAAQLAAQIA